MDDRDQTESVITIKRNSHQGFERDRRLGFGQVIEAAAHVAPAKCQPQPLPLEASRSLVRVVRRPVSGEEADQLGTNR